ncbi:MAG: PilW family protein [Deltaproteobacteria bacterium]|nr:PilW family protein [Candidatus Anaeroferrophillacea bacterium]
MKSIKRKAGFTLVELMVVLAILGIVVAGVLGLMTRQNKAYHSEEAIIDLQMNGRVAMDRISRILRMAGFGCAGNIGAGNPVSGFTTILTATNSNSSPDSLTLISGLRQVAIVDDGDGTPGETFVASTIPIAMIDNLSIGDCFDDAAVYKRYFFITPRQENTFRDIVAGGVGAGTITTNTSLTTTEGDNVYTVRPYTIGIYTDSNNVDCLGINDGSGNDAIAEHIENLQFEYGWDADDNGMIDAAEWVDDPAGNEADVRAVRVLLLFRSAHPDREFEDRNDDDPITVGRQYTLADHVITDPDVHFHRHLIQTTVFLRNMNL